MDITKSWTDRATLPSRRVSANLDHSFLSGDCIFAGVILSQYQLSMAASSNIRIGNPRDFDSLAEVMYEAVRNGSSAYTLEQCEAWVPEVKSGPEWSTRISAQTIFVAEQNQEIVGFMSLAAGGYIDLAFIRPHYQRTGLFRKLYDELETAAFEAGARRLWVHASLTARPAFSAVGFEIVHEESVEIRGQILTRFEMQKCLEKLRRHQSTRIEMVD